MTTRRFREPEKMLSLSHHAHAHTDTYTHKHTHRHKHTHAHTHTHKLTLSFRCPHSPVDGCRFLISTEVTAETDDLHVWEHRLQFIQHLLTTLHTHAHTHIQSNNHSHIHQDLQKRFTNSIYSVVNFALNATRLKLFFTSSEKNGVASRIS